MRQVWWNPLLEPPLSHMARLEHHALVDAWMDAWMDACMDEWMDAWMNWLNSWMDALSFLLLKPSKKKSKASKLTEYFMLFGHRIST